MKKKKRKVPLYEQMTGEHFPGKENKREENFM